jgi:hypothetical protein
MSAGAPRGRDLSAAVVRVDVQLRRRQAARSGSLGRGQRDGYGQRMPLITQSEPRTFKPTKPRPTGAAPLGATALSGKPIV